MKSKFSEMNVPDKVATPYKHETLEDKILNAIAMVTSGSKHAEAEIRFLNETVAKLRNSGNNPKLLKLIEDALASVRYT